MLSCNCLVILCARPLWWDFHSSPVAALWHPKTSVRSNLEALAYCHDTGPSRPWSNRRTSGRPAWGPIGPVLHRSHLMMICAADLSPSIDSDHHQSILIDWGWSISSITWLIDDDQSLYDDWHSFARLPCLPANSEALKYLKCVRPKWNTPKCVKPKLNTPDPRNFRPSSLISHDIPLLIRVALIAYIHSQCRDSTKIQTTK